MEIFTLPRSPYRFDPTTLVDCDLFHLHWVAHMLDWPSFFGRLRAPAVWTLHDMNGFTGGCHYAGACEGWTRACGACPQLGSNARHDLSRRIHHAKKKALHDIPDTALAIATPSDWLNRCVRKSSLLSRFDTVTIPNGIDLDFWQERDTTKLRESLEIPARSVVALFVAEVVANKRKGFLDLLQAFSRLRAQSGVTLVAIGNASTSWKLPNACRSLGPQTDPARLRDLYSMADLFVIPSLEDNLPNTIVEAMACSTPIVGYRAGGIAEMVEDGATGALADVGDVDQLSAAIDLLIERPQERARMGRAARQHAEDRYSDERCARSYLALYDRLLAAR